MSACDRSPLEEFAGPRFHHPALAAHQNVAVSEILARLDEFDGVLLADDVGMGKSWVASAVLGEVARDGSEAEVFVPASLITQWKLLLRFFGSRASVFSHEYLVRHLVDGLPESRGLIVVDEAHRFRNPRTQRYRSLARRAFGQRLLLLTATPVCNSRFDLLALLRLFAADDVLRLHGIISLEKIFDSGDRRALQEVMARLAVRRTVEDLIPSMRFASVHRQVVRYPTIPPDSEIPQLIEQLHFPAIVESHHRELLRSILWHRLQSSSDAFRDSLVRQRRFYRTLSESSRSGVMFSKRDYSRLFLDSDEEVPLQSLLFPGLWAGARDANDGEGMEVAREMSLVERLLAAISATENAKLTALRATLSAEHFPALLFTSAFATARALCRALEGQLRCAMISSHLSRLQHRRAPAGNILAAFRRGEIDVLISTDVAAEGLDLQTARTVVHYDLPWNPVRLDQRNGRAARIGQTLPSVTAFYFVPGRVDVHRTSAVQTLARKNRERRNIIVRANERPIPIALRWQRLLDRALAGGLADLSNRTPVWLVEANESHRKHLQLVALSGDENYTDSIHVLENFYDCDCQRDTVGGSGSQRASFDTTKWMEVLRARLLIPARISNGDRTRMQWRECLEKSRVWDRRWSQRLTLSFPAGVELALQTAIQSWPDMETVNQIAALIDASGRDSRALDLIVRTSSESFSAEGQRTDSKSLAPVRLSTVLR